ncbi:MAG: 4-amino-4-deoxychorismate lyase [Gammaproteobacteria bacterium]|nr:4-amino-4-deoxychorismate lyase [Gammaproteobacteria bacterium]
MSATADAVLVNGVRDAALSALDRGLHFGDGLFETIACVKGRPRFLPLHLERLEFGCGRLQIAAPNLDEIAAEVAGLALDVDRAIVKVLVTAGEAIARGYARCGSETATRITIRYPWPHGTCAQLHDGVMVRTLTLRLGENPRLAGLKHCNRLEQILARTELAAEPHAEGMLFSSSGNLVSATSSNVFLVRDSCLLTPRIDLCGVAGVMRRVVLREARRVGIPARECELRAQDLQAADEVFLTNARLGIWPVRALDARELTPGPVTRHLQSVLAPLLDEPADAY